CWLMTYSTATDEPGSTSILPKNPRVPVNGLPVSPSALFAQPFPVSVAVNKVCRVVSWKITCTRPPSNKRKTTPSPISERTQPAASSRTPSIINWVGELSFQYTIDELLGSM